MTGFSGVAPTTMVSALMAANPSIWAPSWILTTSSLANAWEDNGSELTGGFETLIFEKIWWARDHIRQR